MLSLREQWMPALSAALLALALAAEAQPADGLSLRHEGRLLRVESQHLSLLIAPENGGRVVSLSFDGTEMTGLDPGGHGGLIEEVHTADFPFAVTEQRWSDGWLRLKMEARAGALRVIKEYAFRADRPAFLVRLRFENHSDYALSGPAAPAVRALALPAGRSAAGRQLYCLNRGRGVETFSREPFLHRLNREAGPADLRWLAVSDPVDRRVLGFALHEGGSRCLRPLRSPEGGVSLGWSFPTLPAGSRYETTVTVAALRDFAALAELTPRLAAQSVGRWRGDRLGVHVLMTALEETLPEVSVITRTYDAFGGEGEPCDPILFDRLTSLSMAEDETRSGRREQPPEWLLHEVYSTGRLMARFAVPSETPTASPPPQTASPEPPAVEPLPGGGPRDSAASATEEQRKRGFLAWQFDGAADRPELRVVEMVLTNGEERTLFFGVRALQDIENLRFNLAGETSVGAGPTSVPPAAVDLWTVEEPAGEPARLTPRTMLALGAGETAWVALTADGAVLSPGVYTGDLVFSGPGVLRVPFKVVVQDRPAPGPHSFGLWYDGPWSRGEAPEPLLAKLRGYGVDALTLPEGATDALRHAALRSAFSFLASRAGGGTLPPVYAASRTALPYPYPVWVVLTDAAGPGVAPAAGQNGWTPALLGEHVPSAELLSQLSGPNFIAVHQGCPPDAVPDLVGAAALSGQEPVWTHLNLRGANWRRAVLEVRAALWAAAWQGLAGAMVTCDPPRTAVDRQLAVWHVLRDARQEVALWREARWQTESLPQGQSSGNRQLLLLRERLESVIGPAEHCLLTTHREPRPFRSVYRVSPPRGKRRPTLEQFSAARLTVLDVLSRMANYAPADAGPDLYWQGIPLVRDGLPQWTLVALEGESAWKAARRLREDIEKRTGITLEVQRSLPDDEEQGGRLVIISADEGTPALSGLFPAVSARETGESATILRQDEEALAVAFFGEEGLRTITRGFSPRPSLYAPAREVR